MDLDIEVQRRGRHEPVSALASVADALPGLGIVAAVLGVVITMEAIGGAPETVGQKVAAALVGTFLGILLCYGVVGPIAARLENLGEVETQFYQVLRIAIVSFARGASPILAIEYARRSIPEDLRPSFTEMEISDQPRRQSRPRVPKPRRAGAEPCRNSACLTAGAGNRGAHAPRLSTDGTAAPGKWPMPISSPRMMALFIVLWMMNATTAVKKSVVGYFKDPRGLHAYARRRAGSGG